MAAAQLGPEVHRVKWALESPGQLDLAVRNHIT